MLIKIIPQIIKITKPIFLVITLSILFGQGCNRGRVSSVASTPTSSRSTSSDNGNLTLEKAQDAISRWAEGAKSNSCREHGETCSVSIAGGVREIPQQNAAVAEITFTDFIYKIKNQNNERIFSGKGQATFVRYTDGRWSLSEVRIGDPMFDAVTWKPQIDVR